MFDSIKKMLKMSDSKTKAVSNTYSIGSASMRGTWDFQKGLSYDNAFPSISRIADGFADIRPYAIDSNGKRVENANALNCIYHPNQMQSSMMFRYALATSVLTHRKTYLLAWHKENGYAVAGGEITEQNLAGFTFIENATVRVVNGRRYYRVGTDKREYTDREVLEITVGTDPYDIDAGYAPSVAIRKWADIDDFVASYQGGLFENGAVPAGEFVITARSVADYDDIVAKMKHQFRGSGNNNSVIYTHRPIAPDTGAPLNAQIEWIPFAEGNRSLDLATIFNQVNNKIDSAFGVPASVRGVSENNGYASAKVDERTFSRYVLKPFASKLWDSITHELNRITGGLGYAFTFDLDVPAVADEEKVEAERKLTELNLIISAQNAGFTLDSIVDAFELSKGYKTLKIGENSNPQIENDKPEVDDGNEVDATPEHAVEKSSPKACRHSHELIEHKSADRSTVQNLRQTLISKYENQINEAIKGLEETMENQELLETLQGLNFDELTEIELREIYEQLGIDAPSVEEENELMFALLAILFNRMRKSGSKQFEATIKKFGLEDKIPEDLRHYEISDQAEKTYNEIASGISSNFVNDNAQSIRSTVAKVLTATAGTILGATSETAKKKAKREAKKAITNELQKLPKADDYRIKRITNTEEHRAENLGQIDAISNIEQMTRLSIKLKWRTTSAEPCEFCQSMNGTEVKAGEAFVPTGGIIQGQNGGQMINDYVDMITPMAHPNCQCVFDLVMVEGE